MKNKEAKMWMVLSFVIISTFNTGYAQSLKKIPHLKNNGKTTHLIVDEQPMLLLSGELGNSTSSSLVYLDQALSKCKKLGLNSAITVISWDQFETVEGKYNYTLIDGMIDQAKKYDLKLVVIWFASFKNGTMGYAPEWVKKDRKRFPRVLGPSFESVKAGIELTPESEIFNKNILSPFFEETWKADSKAFAALMRRIKEVDRDQTVVMVQVENEAGTFGVALDQQTKSLELFNQQVPEELLNYLNKNKNQLVPAITKALSDNGNKTKGNWTDIFGSQAVDVFMAWHVAGFMEKVTAAGKAEYNIPMFYNAWLKQPNKKGVPGRYPTGGPIHTMLDIYRAASPSIDFISPDVYFPAFKHYCEAYKHPGNVLFIPECRNNEDAIAKAYWTIAEKDGIGFAPFGVERMPEGTSLTHGYKALKNLSSYILAAQGTNKLKGLYRQVTPSDKNVEVGEWDFDAGELEMEDEKFTKVRFGEWIFNVEFRNRIEDVPAYGLILQLSEDEFILTGKNLGITFSNADTSKVAELIYAEQGEFKVDKWTVRRQLNGDETNCGVRLSLPTFGDALAPYNRQDIVKLKLYAYPK